MRTLTFTLATTILFFMTSFTSKMVLSVTSTAFTHNGMIPAKYSCQGEQASPPLTIGNIPSSAKSLAMIVHDPDAPMKGGFTHWVVWNMDVAGNIPENFKGAEVGLNGTKKPGYMGMCPPSGVHHYHFKVYALDEKLSIGSNTDKAELEKAMKGHILAEGELVGLYSKSK